MFRVLLKGPLGNKRLVSDQKVPQHLASKKHRKYARTKLHEVKEQLRYVIKKN